MEYLSTTQIAQKWGISSRRIQKMCTEKKYQVQCVSETIGRCLQMQKDLKTVG